MIFVCIENGVDSFFKKVTTLSYRYIPTYLDYFTTFFEDQITERVECFEKIPYYNKKYFARK